MATPTFVKRLFWTSAAQRAGGFCIAAYVSLVRLTSRLDRPRPPVEGPCILAAWHSRLMFMPLVRPDDGKALIALISSHRDGRVAEHAIARFGIETASGSSSRGGMRAARELIRHARDGHTLFMTPDGPRGPRMHASAGILELARMTGLPIVPTSMSAGRGKTLGSWDRFLLPGLFTRLTVRWGTPITVGENDDADALLARMTAALTEVQNRADTDAGRALTEPG